MPNKIDELFSPERLRQNWQQTEKRTARPVFAESEGQSPLIDFERLQALVKRRFAGDEAAALNVLMEELQMLLSATFPAGKESTPAENREKNFPAINEVLNRIEDLVDAYGLAARRRKGK